MMLFTINNFFFYKIETLNQLKDLWIESTESSYMLSEFFTFDLDFLINISTYLNIFSLSILGFILNRRNALYILICTELMFFSVISLFLICITLAPLFQNLFQVYTLIILTVASADSIIGLALILKFYKVQQNLNLKQFCLLKN